MQRSTTLGRRSFVQDANQEKHVGPLTRNKYSSVLEGEFPLVSGESLPEVHIEWEQWVCVLILW